MATSTPELLERLRDGARQRRLVYYGEIADALGLDLSLDRDRVEIGRVLGELSEAEHREGRPLISAIVVASNVISAQRRDGARS